MIGKIIGAIAGKHISQDANGGSGIGGALLGVGAATVIRRLGPVGLVAAAVGGYALKKHQEKRRGNTPL
ncbi:hypothetical protein [Novosphingobium sp. 9]|uniref:hypothetical protein n=1 Tax=Novosphingobium sp. 9 TaxID=2025349 RepID=UPI0021B69FFD|nr:hypothetical protein [Novosphingobium sp. 9]